MAVASLRSGAIRKEMLPHCVQDPGAWPQRMEAGHGNNILRATYAKAQGLEQGSRPGDRGGGTKIVRMNCSSPCGQENNPDNLFISDTLSSPDPTGANRSPTQQTSDERSAMSIPGDRGCGAEARGGGGWERQTLRFFALAAERLFLEETIIPPLGTRHTFGELGKLGPTGRNGQPIRESGIFIADRAKEWSAHREAW